jgi:hypothetical protein
MDRSVLSGADFRIFRSGSVRAIGLRDNLQLGLLSLMMKMMRKADPASA